MKTLILVSLFILSTACSKHKEVTSSDLAMMNNEINEVRAMSVVDDVKVGNCWSHRIKITDYIQASFIKDQTYNSAAYLLMAYDPNTKVVLFAQPESDGCSETLENSAKCKYWIRAEPLKDMHIFFKDKSEIVSCPKGLTIKEIVKRASPEEVARFDFSKI